MNDNAERSRLSTMVQRAFIDVHLARDEARSLSLAEVAERLSWALDFLSASLDKLYDKES